MDKWERRLNLKMYICEKSIKMGKKKEKEEEMEGEGGQR